MNKYPEVYSLKESLAILDKYKDDLTKEQYEQNKSIICGFAIENMFANEEDIINLIKVDKQEKTPDEIIAEYKKEWGVSDLNNSELEQNSKIEKFIKEKK
ncbi:hypothetical protein [Campylobacter sp.]|uniref:hypothetical protein n=1 Tax=Campylobacter sp. TaxID=205 RepID=UPI0025BC2FDC|nr:hypothetical protein [Campylobacter sp.]